MWVQAHWIIYDMVFYEVPRLRTFQRLRSVGLSRREAAEMMHEVEREG